VSLGTEGTLLGWNSWKILYLTGGDFLSLHMH